MDKQTQEKKTISSLDKELHPNRGKILTVLILICFICCIGLHIRYTYLNVFAGVLEAEQNLGYSTIYNGSPSLMGVIDFHRNNIKDMLSFLNIPSGKVVFTLRLELDEFQYWFAFLLRLPCYILAFIFIRVFRKHRKVIFYILSLCLFIIGLFCYLFNFSHAMESHLIQHNATLGYEDKWNTVLLSGFDIEAGKRQHEFTEKTGIEVVYIPNRNKE